MGSQERLLYELMFDSFTLDELASLAVLLEIRGGIEEIAGTTRSTKTYNIIRYCANRNIIENLLLVLRQERPLKNWPNFRDLEREMASSSESIAQSIDQTISNYEAEQRLLRKLHTALEQAGELEDPRDKATALSDAARQFSKLSYFGQAASINERAAGLFKEANDSQAAAECYVEAAENYLELNVLHSELRARAALEQGSQILPEKSRYSVRARIHLVKEYLAYCKGDLEGAAEEYGHLIDLLPRVEIKNQLPFLFRSTVLVAALSQLNGHSDQSRSILMKALDRDWDTDGRALKLRIRSMLLGLLAIDGRWQDIDEAFESEAANNESQVDTVELILFRAAYTSALAQSGEREKSREFFDDTMESLQRVEVDLSIRASLMQDLAFCFTRFVDFNEGYWQQVLRNDPERLDLNLRTHSGSKHRQLLSVAEHCFLEGKLDEAETLAERALMESWIVASWSGQSEAYERLTILYAANNSLVRAVLAGWETGDSSLISKTVQKAVGNLHPAQVTEIVEKITSIAPTAYKQHSSLLTLTHLAELFDWRDARLGVKFALEVLGQTSSTSSASINSRRQAVILLRSTLPYLLPGERMQIVSLISELTKTDEKSLIVNEFLHIVDNAFELGVDFTMSRECIELAKIACDASAQEDLMEEALSALYQIADKSEGECRTVALTQLDKLGKIEYLAALEEPVDLEQARKFIDDLADKYYQTDPKGFAMHGKRLRMINNFNAIIRDDLTTHIIERMLAIVNNPIGYMSQIQEAIATLRFLPDAALDGHAEQIVNQLLSKLSEDLANPVEWPMFGTMLGTEAEVQREILFALGRFYHLATVNQREEIGRQFVVFADAEDPAARTGVAMGLSAIEGLPSIPLPVQLPLLSLLVDEDELTRHWAAIASTRLIERSMLDVVITNALIEKLVRRVDVEKSSSARRALSFGLANLIKADQLPSWHREAVLGALRELALDVNFHVRRHALAVLGDEPTRDYETFLTEIHNPPQ